MVVPQETRRSVEVIELTRSHLANATQTAMKLYHRFPKALPEIVGDRQEWIQFVKQLLDALKPMVHDHKEAPYNLFERTDFYRTRTRRLAKSLVAENRALENPIAALSWIHGSTPGAVNKTLSWLDRNTESIVAIASAAPEDTATEIVLHLCKLGNSKASRNILALMECLAEPRVFDTPTTQGEQIVNQLCGSLSKRNSVPPDKVRPPRANLGSAFVDFARWLPLQEDATIKQVMRILGLLDIPQSVQAWSSWWDEFEDLLRRAKKLDTASDKIKKSYEPSKRLIARLRRLRSRTPRPIPEKHLFDALKAATTPQYLNLSKEMVISLSAIPQDYRISVFLHWHNLQCYLTEWKRPENLRAIIREFGLYVKSEGFSESSVAPWLESLRNESSQSQYSFSIDDDLLDEDVETAEVSHFFRTLAAVHSKHPEKVNRDTAYRLIVLVQATKDSRRAANLVSALVRADRLEKYISPQIARAANQLAAENPDDFPLLVEALDNVSSNISPPLENILPHLEGFFADNPKLLKQILLGPHVAELIRCGQSLSIIDSEGEAKPPKPHIHPLSGALPEWAERYPSFLHEPMRLIISADERAQKTAQKILDRDFPRSEKTKKELETLKTKTLAADPDSATRMRSRIRNLEKTLSHPKVPSPSRLERLRKKLEAAAHGVIVRNWHERLRAVVVPCITRQLGLSEAPDWVQDERTLTIVEAIGDLERPDRVLAGKLFQTRSGQQPWDLREEPGNVSFVDKLTSLGIDTSPWLDGIGVKQSKDRSGKNYSISFEDDPLEIFHMGGHFGTCLSPGQFNFFSVIANAADINKRVIYARTDKGTVIGRCLLALTNEGAILTFYPYCHNEEVKFSKVVKDFVEELADAMGTVILSRGHVPTLVAREWYDDGPHDIAERFAFLEQGSKFRKSLGTIEPSEFVDQLLRHFDPLPLNQLTLPLVLELDELEARPELIRVLLPFLASHEWSDLTQFRIAKLGEKAGDYEMVNRILDKWAARYLISQYRRHRYVDVNVLHFVSRYKPSLALRVLKQTRDSGVRSWNQEVSSERLYAAGVATMALNRPKQAHRLFRLALRLKGGSDQTRQQAKSMVKRIEKELAGR